MKRLETPTEFKFSGQAGAFSGYAAVFGNVDSGGERILPGAFKEFHRTRDGKILVLYQHSSRDPIGKADVTQDEYGLHLRGELLLEDATARKAHGLMKAGLLDAMSIGYRPLPDGETFTNGAWELSKLKLYEVSVVTFGMNELALIDAVKSVMECASPRELDAVLRDALKLSARKARAAASALWPILSDPDGRWDDPDDRKSAQWLKRSAAESALLVAELDRQTQFLKEHR